MPLGNTSSCSIPRSLEFGSLARRHLVPICVSRPGIEDPVFPSDDPYLDQDAVFGVREQLIMDYKEANNPSILPDDLAIKSLIKAPFYTVDFDFVLVSK